MRKVHCAYANEVFYRSLDILEDTSIKIGGVDEFYAYRPINLHVDNFYQQNERILSQPLGAGLWAWKPFVILETMKKVDDGDIVLYTDAGMSVLWPLNILFEITSTNKDNGMLFEPSMIYGPHLHSVYTKRDCFVVMDLDHPYYHQSRMLHAAFSVWMKTQANIEFLQEWLKYVTDERAITDWPNVCGQPNLPDYAEHRYDQAILSLLRLKYDRELYREPTQFSNNERGKFPNSPYGQLFNHHSGEI